MINSIRGNKLLAEKKHEKKTKKVRYVLPVQQKCLSLQRQKGVLAHLARARHWQCRGERFESAMLHDSKPSNTEGFIFFKLVLEVRFGLKKRQIMPLLALRTCRKRIQKKL